MSSFAKFCLDEQVETIKVKNQGKNNPNQNLQWREGPERQEFIIIDFTAFMSLPSEFTYIKNGYHLVNTLNE